MFDCSGDVPLTQQSAKDECDINVIVERGLRGGDLSLLARSQAPMYGDFTNLPDLRSALSIVNKANALFMSLDARIRERFYNDPALMMDFLKNPANYDEAVKLGMVIPKAKAVDGSKDDPGVGRVSAAKGSKAAEGGV